MESRIKMVRKSEHLTQMQFGERIGVKGNTITGYETGIRVPSNAIISAICKEFQINEEWLKSGEGEMKANAPEDLVDQLAREYNVGEAGALLLHALVKVFHELGEERLNDIIDNFLIGDLYDARMKDPRNKYASYDADSSETQSKERSE